MEMTVDNIKRPRLEDSEHNSSKKSRVSQVPGESILLKQLFPSLITGLIIGKGGEAITKLQADTNTNIKMSKNGDFFPGTSDRVCIIVGRVEDVKEAHFAIWEKIKKKQEIAGDEAKLNTQYRIVVPNVTVGMIIGKAGCYVKQIKDDTGSTVQVSAKSPNPLLLERIVTISGSCEQVTSAFDMVFAKIVDDPQSGSCANMSYTDFGSSGGNLNGSDLGLMSPAMMGMGGASGMPAMPASSFGMNPFSSFNFGEAIRKMNPVNVENLKTTLRASGCSAQGVEEITASLLVLAHYNLLNNLQATQPGTVSLEYLANVLNGMSPVAAAAIASPTSQAVVSPYGSFISTNNKHEQENKQDQQHMMNFYASLNTTSANGSSGIEVLTELPDGGKELQINENLIGAVLGQGGRNIVEIQKFTSTNISISKKGVFAPGTKNRLVTIRGGSQADIDKAVFMVQQYVLQEESKRSRSDPHLSLGKF